MQTTAEFMRSSELKSMQQQNQVITDPHANQNYVSSLSALKLTMYQNISSTEQLKKQKVQGMKHTLNCAYEGFGPNGSMVIVDTLTNNVNRTAADVRADVGKTAEIWVSLGAVSYMFDNTAIFGFAGEDADEILRILDGKGHRCT